jgi:hypothetical protein
MKQASDHITIVRQAPLRGIDVSKFGQHSNNRIKVTSERPAPLSHTALDLGDVPRNTIGVVGSTQATPQIRVGFHWMPLWMTGSAATAACSRWPKIDPFEPPRNLLAVLAPMRRIGPGKLHAARHHRWRIEVTRRQRRNPTRRGHNIKADPRRSSCCGHNNDRASVSAHPSMNDIARS